MLDLSVLESFLLAICLGLLIGLEREYARYRKQGHDYAGIRTFPLIALFGAMSAYLGEEISMWILLLGIALCGVLILLAYFFLSKHTTARFGATSELAGFLTFFLGMLVYYGEVSLAVILTIVITILLYARSLLHQFAEKIKEKELADTLKFAVIAFIILPLLPNRGYGPYELFNPFMVWLMVVLISAVGFAGYLLLKWIGRKGLALTGLLGGLVSSTAVTMHFAERSIKEKKVLRNLVLGVILANGIMFIRILVIVFLIDQKVLLSLLVPFSVLLCLTAAVSYALWHNLKKVPGRISLGSPLRLTPALKFGFFFAVIMALIKVANVYLASNGVYLVSFLSGFADVDAITVSLSQLAATLDLITVRNGIVVAVVTNMAAKGGIAYWFGSKEFGKWILITFIGLIAVGLLLLWW